MIRIFREEGVFTLHLRGVAMAGRWIVEVAVLASCGAEAG